VYECFIRESQANLISFTKVAPAKQVTFSISGEKSLIYMAFAETFGSRLSNAALQSVLNFFTQ
jgi:hypothetical protein